MTTVPLPEAPAVSAGFCPERLDRLDKAMQAEIDAGHYAGISLMVARHGTLVKFQRYADLQVLEDDKLVPLDRPMTMRHVMASCAGFAFGVPLGTTNPKVDEMYVAAGLFSGTNEDLIAKLAALPLEAQPGTCSGTAFSKRFKG